MLCPWKKTKQNKHVLPFEMQCEFSAVLMHVNGISMASMVVAFTSPSSNWDASWKLSVIADFILSYVALIPFLIFIFLKLI